MKVRGATNQFLASSENMKAITGLQDTEQHKAKKHSTSTFVRTKRCLKIAN